MASKLPTPGKKPYRSDLRVAPKEILDGAETKELARLSTSDRRSRPERERLGVDHQQVGLALMELWKTHPDLLIITAEGGNPKRKGDL